MTVETKRRKALTARPSGSDYEVGYGKPPVAHRFKPGQSGNPRGRPKGSRSNPAALTGERMKSILLEEAYRTIKVNEGTSQISVPMAQAVIRSLAVNAAKGNQRAQRLFTELLLAAERENKRQQDELLEAAISYKIEWEIELERRRRFNIEGPTPLPHPDDIIINMRTGGVEFRGPMTKEEQKIWEEARARKAECDRSIAEDEQLLRDQPDYPYKKQVLDDIEHEKRIRAIICRMIPD
jgi:hypothetical protein